MARRGDPARIEEARREAIRQRLLGTGMLPGRVEALMAAWEDEAIRRGLADRPYSGADAWEWMASQAR